MTVQEKVGQLIHESPAIPRLGIIEYNWWNECLHGVGLAYLATVFPQAIGMAATWDTALIHRVSTAISDEARAKHRRELEEYGKVRQMRGLTFFTPNINIFRDPRWGRGQETYGEDPYLTSKIAVSFIKGLQGDDPRCLKTAATAKHYAVHSGPEALRHTFNALPTYKDLQDTYLPAFRACVRDAHVRSVMCAYNKLEGTYACRDEGLLNGILRREWKFDGFVVSDCGAPVSLSAGCDLVCAAGWDLQDTFSIHDFDYLIDTAVTRLMKVRFELGMFDPPELVPYASVPYSVVDCDKHRQIARETARKSIVLLKNNGILPLKPAVKTITVTGPHSDWEQVMWGNYYGTPSYTITPLEGIMAQAGSNVKVVHTPGCGLVDSISGEYARAESLARGSDAVIVCCGLSSEAGGPVVLENENMDRETLGLPDAQDILVRKLVAAGKPVVVVLVNGGPLSVNFADSSAAGIIEAWYGGQEAGRAIADVLFGAVNPSGRLPVTVYKSEADIPEFTDYLMEHGRTYRYFAGEPLYPFGYGLSYTTFSYSELNVWSDEYSTSDDTIYAEVTLTNTGTIAGEEVTQLYVSTPGAGGSDPLRSLKGFGRTKLDPGETAKVSFVMVARDFSRIGDDGSRIYEPGLYTLYAGGGQPDARGSSGTFSEIYIQGALRTLEF
jgi:beta-glucosidase